MLYEARIACYYRENTKQNQPFDYPRSNPSTVLRTSARGLLRVDTERRCLPHREDRGFGRELSRMVWRRRSINNFAQLYTQKRPKLLKNWNDNIQSQTNTNFVY